MENDNDKGSASTSAEGRPPGLPKDLPAMAIDRGKRAYAYAVKHWARSLFCAASFLVLALVVNLTAAFFITFALVILLMGLDSRISIVPFMICLAVCPILLAMDRDSGAGTAAVWAYYFLAIGFIIQLATYGGAGGRYAGPISRWARTHIGGRVRGEGTRPPEYGLKDEKSFSLDGIKDKRAWTDPFLYLAVLIGIAVHYVWFFSTSILTHGDNIFYFPEQLRQIATFQAWSLAGLGGIEKIPSAYSYSLLSGLLARAGFSYAIIERMIFFWPMVIVGSVGSYLLVKKISGSRVGGLLGSIVFSLNTFMIVSAAGYIPIATAIAWFPLTLYLFMELAERPSLWRALACSLPLFIISCLEFRIFYVCLLPLVLLYFFSLFERRARKRFFAYTSLFFLPVLVTLLLNAYWLLPYYAGGLQKGLQGIIIGRPLFTGGIGDTNLLHNAFATFHPMWSGGKLINFTVHPIPFYWFLIPLLAFSVLLFEKLRKDLRVLYFCLIALIGIFLTKFFFPPFPGAYQWLYDHFPGFSAFRDPSKFIFLIFLPYAVLIGCLVGYLLRKAGGKGWKHIGVLLMAALIALPFLISAVPVVTRSAGTIFTGRDIPDDYVVLKDFILDQPEFFRTLWVPTLSRWSYYDDSHPRVSCVDALGLEWMNLQRPGHDDFTSAENITDILERPFSRELLSSASIKYVIVPLRDVENDDDFFVFYGDDRQAFIDRLNGLDYLERIDIGTRELAVFYNRAYNPPVFSPDGICRLDPQGDIDPQYLLARSILGSDTPFTMDEVPAAVIRIDDLLAGEGEDVASGAGVEVSPAAAGEALSLYSDRGRGELRCSLADGTVTLWRVVAGELLMDGRPVSALKEGREALRTVRIGPGNGCWLEADGVWLFLEKDKEVDLGEMDRVASLRIHSLANNLIPDGSFEQGPWTEQVIDCYAYDDRPVLAMSLNDKDTTEGRYSLQLEATRHIAGTSVDFAVQAGTEYSLGFDYQSPNAAEAGYHLEFNDDAKTTLSARLPVSGGDWQHFEGRVTAPPGATSAILFLYAYESDGTTAMIVRYDAVGFSPLGFSEELDLAVYENRFVMLPVDLPGGEIDFAFREYEESGRNLIPDGSFEQGPWTEQVIDSYAYDDRPVLAMSLNDEEKTDGRYSLQLEATRHTAGTCIEFPVQGNSDYYLSFDCQSPNGTKAGYNIQFDDEAKTSVDDQLPIIGTAWQRIRERINVPLGATSAVLSLYGYESNGQANIITRYDRVEFSRVPRGPGLYYLVRTADTAPVDAAAVVVKKFEPDRETIDVSSSAAPFILVQSQLFDAGWRLAVESGEAGGAESMIDPVGIAGESGGEGESEHFHIDGWLNAWYVDPGEYFANNPDEVSADVTLDLELALEFYPQRQARWGSILTLLTFLVVLCVALAGLFIRGRARLRKRREPR
jgi:hypothetical protein